ncbi:MAG: hypothetical protein KAS17_05125 [Victivallaceae bacterium]|nr:hypothetical protein [Victivallaceae bacterium]
MRYLIAFIFTIGLIGCGKKEIPPPPTAHALLVKKLFNNLSQKQHDPAVKRIQKVCALAPSNEFLIQLDERESCNNHVRKAQKLLDTAKVPQALAIINSARHKYPLSRNLLAIQIELTQLEGLQKRVKLLNAARSSKEMNLQINAIAQFIKKYPDGKVLRPLLRKKILQSFKQKLHEEERARFDILCDLATARKAERLNQSLNNTLLAVLSIANAATVNKNERVKPDLLD